MAVEYILLTYVPPEREGLCAVASVSLPFVFSTFFRTVWEEKKGRAKGAVDRAFKF